MLKNYHRTLPQYPIISLAEERRLIAKAKRGHKEEAEELILRRVNFIIFRIYKKTFPLYIDRFGEDILAQAVFMLYDKSKTYNSRRKDNHGNPRPV